MRLNSVSASSRFSRAVVSEDVDERLVYRRGGDEARAAIERLDELRQRPARADRHHAVRRLDDLRHLVSRGHGLQLEAPERVDLLPQLADGVESHAVAVPMQVLDHEHRQVDLGELVHEGLDLLLILDDVNRAWHGMPSAPASTACRARRWERRTSGSLTPAVTWIRPSTMRMTCSTNLVRSSSESLETSLATAGMMQPDTPSSMLRSMSRSSDGKSIRSSSVHGVWMIGTTPERGYAVLSVTCTTCPFFRHLCGETHQCLVRPTSAHQ